MGKRKIKPAKIGVKRQRALEIAINEAVAVAQIELLSNEIDHSPETWSDETRRLFDAITEVGNKTIKAIFEDVFIPNDK